MSSESGASYGGHDDENMMSDNDYGAPSMDDMVDHDIDDTSTSMDYMAEHHHYYDYDAATVHDMASYTDFEPSSINVMRTTTTTTTPMMWRDPTWTTTPQGTSRICHALHIMWTTTPTMSPHLDDTQGYELKSTTAMKHLQAQEDGAQGIFA